MKTATAFDDNGNPIPTVEFDYAALDSERGERGNPLLAVVDEELVARIESLEAEVARYITKAAELAKVIFNTILADLPNEQKAGRLTYLFAFAIGHSQFKSQAELAKHLGMSGAAVSQQLKAFRATLPLNSHISSPVT